MIKKKKGFTLMELLITLALMGIVAAAISTFFFSNYNTLFKVSKELDLQREGERAIDFISKKAMESKGIGEIQPGINTLDQNSITDVTKFVFKIPNQDVDDTTIKGNIFWLETVEGKVQLNYSEGNFDSVNNSYIATGKTVISTGIKSIELKSSNFFKDASNVEVTIQLEEGQEEKTINSIIYFRNKVD
ncbi:hypothetical protein CLHOM_00840 [Clostridium homopropionicum DSM 5847]|uniref:Prepilin-type N-terminal cleavage/methylation domain-containing protein n=1 Tax=Clostridium homopropionicum DSM 5847 TaxID=1121318 RepID=A0A0L6ZF56_9CLOT|nr:type II secretion system protein [Clostridium homopropionicum]KOA21413.1 hypothetical protein CLHOM_00840 [Clostridium homopropionicum DSM 5847]SFG10673.1 prepilin-type N-terminal cleavage/methylation domain-containing protein [Clostridium homopropionicum]